MSVVRLAVEFVEGYLTVFVSTISGVMLQQGVIAMPSKGALILGALGGALAGIRKVQAKLSAPNGQP